MKLYVGEYFLFKGTKDELTELLGNGDVTLKWAQYYSSGIAIQICRDKQVKKC